MKPFLIGLFLMGCVISTKHEDASREKTDLFVIADGFEHNNRHALNLSVIATESLSQATINKRLMLVSAPTKDCFNIDEAPQRHAISVKKLSSSFVVTAKHELKAGLIYGLYTSDRSLQHYCLLYAFRVNGPPAIISHDLGAGDPKMVRTNRQRMRFTFDQPIRLSSDESVRVVNLDSPNGAVTIQHIVVDGDQKTLWIYFDENNANFSEGFHYQIQFAGVTNEQQMFTEEKPFNLLAQTSDQNPRRLNDTPVINLSSRSAHFSWSVFEEHRIEVYLRDSNQSAFIMQRIIAEAPKPQSAEDIAIHRWKITGLTAQSSYDYFLRAEDSHGRVSVARGDFVTSDESFLQISEIMMNPLSDAQVGQDIGEYLEIANGRNDGSLQLEGTSVQIEDIRTGRKTTCPLKTRLVLPPNGHALVVGREFNPRLYGLFESNLVIRLETTALCHGFANQSPKIIRLINQHGFLLDHYEGDLWPAKKGLAIARSPNMGLDAERKYCYSTASPGKQNGSCG